jgi:hypothetical protein
MFSRRNAFQNKVGNVEQFGNDFVLDELPSLFIICYSEDLKQEATIRFYNNFKNILNVFSMCPLNSRRLKTRSPEACK